MTPVVSSSPEVRAQVERLLADPLFNQSKRYGSFLRYATERALKKTLEHATERSIGTEVFGRSPNYDTDADPIVRVTASEVRKRLAQYYDDPAHSSEIRVLIHKGSYVAEFVAPGVQAPPEESGLSQVSLAQPMAESRTGRRWYCVIGLAGVCVIVAVLVWVLQGRPSISELFWAPVLDGPRNILISVPQFSDHVHLVGVENPPLTWSDALTPTPDSMGVSWPIYASRLLHVRDLEVACRLSEFLGSQRKHVLIKGEHDATLRDLRDSPAVILGGLNNQWTSRLLPQARFSFDGEGTVRFIRDKQNPANRQWGFDSKVRSGNREKDFIIISRVSDSLSGRVTVLAGGFSAWGTEAAVELLTDPNQMQAVLASAPVKWSARNVQIALECTVVNLNPSIPRLLAAYSW